MPLQNYCDVMKTKERELEELSSPVAAGPDGPDHGNCSLESIPSLILEIRSLLLQLGIAAHEHTGKVAVIRSTRSKLSFQPGHLAAVLNGWILINVGFLLG